MRTSQKVDIRAGADPPRRRLTAGGGLGMGALAGCGGQGGGAAPRRRRLTAVVGLGMVALAACGGQGVVSAPSSGPTGLPQGGDRVTLDPGQFTADITNRYWPMAPGDRWVYEDTDADGNVQ